MAQSKVRVVNVKEVKRENVAPLLKEAASRKDGLLFGKAAWGNMRDFLADEGLQETVLEKSPEGYFRKSVWTIEGVPTKIQVEYAVPMYKNSKGFTRTGRRLRIIA